MTLRRLAVVGARRFFFIICWAIIVVAAPAFAQDEKEPQGYKLIEGVDCDIRVQSSTQNAYGKFVEADGVKLVCDGQPISLLDGKVRNNWLETRDFGKFFIKPLFGLAIYVTPEQNIQLKTTIAPHADLISASEFGDIRRVGELLAAKSDVNVKGRQGFTPLMLAAEGLQLEVVRALLSAGANVNAKADDGGTALMLLLEGSSPKQLPIVEALLAAGADVNVTPPNSRTALMETAMHGDDKVVAALLAAGAKPNLTNQGGETALILALKYKYGNSDEVVRLLKDAQQRNKT
jgi:hypothetical protein